MKQAKTQNVKIVPEHLALIPNGNRRWSKVNKLKLLIGYRKGYEKFINFCTWAKSFGVKTISIWSLSTENIKNRSKEEISILYDIYVSAATDPKMLEMLKSNNACVKIVGNMSLLPKNVQRALKLLERKTKNYKDLTINILVAYGGKDDIKYAIKKIYNHAINGKIKNITDKLITENMRTAALPEVDYIIRTSGEMRLSGFLPWQADYSELYFTKKFWPEFEKEDLREALDVYSERQRRFGK